MRYDILFGFPFTKTQLNKLGYKDSSESNGCYWYGKDYIIINLICSEFKSLKKDDDLIDWFSKVDTHERIHREIYKITKNDINTRAEERFVCLMTGQEKWKA